MIEIRNTQRGPIQVPIRSRREVRGGGTRAFTTLVIPGLGAGNNVRLIEDELHTHWIDRLEKEKLIATRRIPNKIRKDV